VSHPRTGLSNGGRVMKGSFVALGVMKDPFVALNVMMGSFIASSGRRARPDSARTL